MHQAKFHVHRTSTKLQIYCTKISVCLQKDSATATGGSEPVLNWLRNVFVDEREESRPMKFQDLKQSGQLEEGLQYRQQLYGDIWFHHPSACDWPGMMENE